jgi:hypothetical protein
MPDSTARRIIPPNLSRLWGGLTQRERLLVIAAGLAASIFVPLKAHDWADERAIGYATASEAAQTAAASAATNYPALEVQASHELAKARSWAVQGKSVPIARVLLEEECLSAALKAGVTDAEVHSSETVDHAGPLSFVNLEISGAFTWPTLQALVANLSKAGHLFIVEEIEAPDSPRPRFRLAVRVPIAADAVTK